MIGPIRTAVIPAAGLGTRLLPATRAIPKEMLTVVDRPVIQYAVDEARGAGIERIVFVVSPDRRAIQDHYAGGGALEATLAERGRKSALAAATRGLPPPLAVAFAEQPAPLGLGHAIWCARDLVGDEPFAVLLPDVIFGTGSSLLSAMLDTYRATGGNVVGIVECRPEEAHRFGIVDPGERISDAAFLINGMVEKPPPGTAPSNLKLNGRYVLQPEVFAHLSTLVPGALGEIQLTDGLARLAADQPIVGVRYEGHIFDCGSKAGFVAANVAFALADPALAAIVREEVRRSAGAAD